MHCVFNYLLINLFLLQPAAGNMADYFTTPIVQATPAYDSATKAYYTPVAAVAPAPTGATIYTLPVDAATVYQATQKKFYPVASPLIAPSASQATMYAVSAEPVYQTCKQRNVCFWYSQFRSYQWLL